MGVLADFLIQCGNLEGPEIDDNLQEVSGQLLAEMEREPSLVGKVLAQLEQLPPHGCSWLAIVLGHRVEDGADPADSVDALLAVLRRNLKRLPQWDRDGDDDGEVNIPELDEDQEVLADALNYLCQSLVAHLARSPRHLQPLRADAELDELLDFACAYADGPVWLLSLLRRCSGNLVVLHPESRQGFRVSYAHVETCFHLFSLIQASLGSRLPGGHKVNKQLAAAARGGYHEQELSDEAWWDYAHSAAPMSGMVETILGEVSVDSIPQVDGQAVIVLRPCPPEPPVWGSRFFGPSLQAAPSRMTLDGPLSKTDVDQLMIRLGLV